VTDVWDESRALDWIENYGVGELVLSNWKPPEAGPVVLFRPLPMILVTVVAKAIGNFEAAWRALRLVNAGLILLGLSFALSFVRTIRGDDPMRDLLLTIAVLWSGSAMICAGWFANVFDVSVFFLLALGFRELAKGRGLRAGSAFGAAFFCKEVAVLVFPLLVVLYATDTTDRKETRSAIALTGALAAIYLILRLAVVTPGSAPDLREPSFAGMLEGLYRMPETMWWQVADVPIPLLGSCVTLAAMCLLRSRAAILGALATLGVSAMMYGELIQLGETPLLNPSNFAGRLYLVPALVLLLLLTLFGRRWAIAVVLVPLVWGGALTVGRHVRFQQAYRAVYHVAAEAENPPLRVDCRLYRGWNQFHHRLRGVQFGDFPDAQWRLRRDGTLEQLHAPPAGG
jgi:hypothetical protein